MTSSGWDKFWKDQKQSFHEVMKISTGFFASQLERTFDLKPGDEILDYGCGPGFLSDYLAVKNISITGVDINASFIEYNKNKHPGSLYILITSDTEQNKTIFKKHLEGKKFDFIILLSVVQYFKKEAELDNLIKIFLSYLKEYGKIIVADVIDPRTSSLSDVVSLFAQCIKKGKPIVFFRFMFYLMSSDYKKLSRNTKLLRLSEQSIRQIADNNGLNCEKIKGLTIHTGRANYILSKNQQT